MHACTLPKSSCIGKQPIPQPQLAVWEYEPNISFSGFSKELGNLFFFLKIPSFSFKYLLLIYRNMIGHCKLTVCPADMLNSLISSRSIFWWSLCDFLCRQ